MKSSHHMRSCWFVHSLSVRWIPILCSHNSLILTVLQGQVPVMAGLLIMEITYVPVLHAISNHVDKTIAEPVLCALSISTVQLTENVARAVLISTFLLSCLSFFGVSLNEPEWSATHNSGSVLVLILPFWGHFLFCWPWSVKQRLLFYRNCIESSCLQLCLVALPNTRVSRSVLSAF